MQIFHTGAENFQQVQLIGGQSLGGYISSSEAQQALNAIFGNVSEYGKWLLNKSEYRVLALYNDGDVTLTNLQVWLDQIVDADSDVLDTPFASFKLGHLAATADDCGDILIGSKLSSQYNKPLSVTMVDANEEGEALALPDLEPGQYMGLVISRTITDEAREDLTDEQYEAILNQELSLATMEQFDLNFSFDP